jgi:serine/threonine protein kinase
VCLVPQAVSARGANPHVTAKPIPTTRGGDGKNFTAAIALIVLVTASGFLAIEMFVFWFMYRKRKIKAHVRTPFGKDAQMNAHYNSLIRLTFEEIKEITSDLANKLGPSVYKGALPNKTTVIVKALNDVTANEKDFRVAVSTLGRMHHRNLVLLMGFCFEANNRFLMYEFVHNGSLDKWLLNMEPDHNEGTWQQRLDIALGVARALAYLHSECQICVAHGNLKLENVLLDENFIPKLTDFGLGSLFEEEAASSSVSPSERDIYMFGEMLLQIVTCKRDILSENLNHLVEKTNEEPNSEDSIISEEVERVVRIALWCMQNQPFLRPSIGEVVKVLEGTLSVDRPPLGFAFRPDQMEGRVLTEVEVDSS